MLIKLSKSFSLPLYCINIIVLLQGQIIKYEIYLDFFLQCEVNPDTTEPLDDLTPEVITWLKSLGCQYTKVSEIITNKPKEVMGSIQKGIDKANKKAVSNAQKVQKFAIIPVDFSLPTGELGLLNNLFPIIKISF